MGLFDFLKAKSNNERFLTEDSFGDNRNKQMQMTPQVIGQLHKLGATEEKELKLEFFFYTNSSDKAKQFSDELAKLDYSVQHRVSASDKKLFIITGWTTKIKMEDNTVVNWTKQMCDLGYKYDCEFDGWGTNPDQE